MTMRTNSMQPRILIVQTGSISEPVLSTFGDAEDHFMTNKRKHTCSYETCKVYLGDQKLPTLTEFDGIIFTGSSSMLDEDLPWMRQSIDMVKQALDREIPLLGVCFGHQLLGAACAAAVGPHPAGRHHGSTELTITKTDPILPPREKFYAQISHRDAILGDSPLITVLAQSSYDPYHVIKVGKCAWGVQFHPEWDINISRTYVDMREDMLTEALGEKEYLAISKSLRPSVEASTVIDNFLLIASQRR